MSPQFHPPSCPDEAAMPPAIASVLQIDRTDAPTDHNDSIPDHINLMAEGSVPAISVFHLRRGGINAIEDLIIRRICGIDGCREPDDPSRDHVPSIRHGII